MPQHAKASPRPTRGHSALAQPKVTEPSRQTKDVVRTRQRRGWTAQVLREEEEVVVCVATSNVGEDLVANIERRGRGYAAGVSKNASSPTTGRKALVEFRDRKDTRRWLSDREEEVSNCSKAFKRQALDRERSSRTSQTKEKRTR